MTRRNKSRSFVFRFRFRFGFCRRNSGIKNIDGIEVGKIRNAVRQVDTWLGHRAR